MIPYFVIGVIAQFSIYSEPQNSWITATCY